MHLWRYLQTLERRFAWSFLGFVLAAVLGVFTLYIEFLRDERPGVTFTILSSASVLDVNEEIKDLSVAYAGKDLRSSGLSLRVIVVRIENDGSETILPAHFDPKIAFGFDVSSGEIVRSELIDASSEYLQDAVTLQTLDAGVRIAPCIIEDGEWFAVKAIVLHPNAVPPALAPHGKIADVKSMSVVSAVHSGRSEPVVYTIFGGSAVVQMSRLLAYPIGLVFLIIFIGVPIVFASEQIGRARRKSHVRQFLALRPDGITLAHKYIIDSYVNYGIDNLRELDAAIRGIWDMHGLLGRRPVDAKRYRENLFLRLEMEGFARLVDTTGDWSVNPELKAALADFLQFIGGQADKGGAANLASSHREAAAVHHEDAEASGQ